MSSKAAPIKEIASSISPSNYESQEPTHTSIILDTDTGNYEKVIYDWTKEEEAKVYWKADLIVMPLLFFAFFILQIDRGNVSNALTGGLTKELKLTNEIINTGTGLFNVGIVVFEIPANILLQKFGPARWLSFQVVLWSVLATLQACITNHEGFLAARFFMGMLEAGYIPGGLYYISTWYKKEQLPIRYGIFFIGNVTASAASGLIASGILKHLAGLHGKAGWKYIFIVEGVMGIGYGLVFAFLLPNSSQDPRPFHRGFRLFTERESQILRGAALLDDPEKISSAKEISLRELKEVLSEWRTWLHFLFTLSYMQNIQALSTYVPTIVKNMGYSAVTANAMTSVGNWIGVVVVLSSLLFIHFFKRLSVPALFVVVVQLTCTSCLLGYSQKKKSKGKYALLVVVMGFDTIGHIINCSWASANSRKPAQRSMRMAIMVMAANMAGICAGQILRSNDAPLYHNAFLALTVLSAFTLVVLVFMIVQYILTNKKLDKKYPQVTNKLTDNEVATDSSSYEVQGDVKFHVVGTLAENEKRVDELVSGLVKDSEHVNIKNSNQKTISYEEGFRYLY